MKFSLAMISLRFTLVASFAMLVLSSSGCVTFTKHAVPATRLPHQYEAPSKCNLHPINFQLLGRPQAPEHIVGPGDVLSVSIQGVIPPNNTQVNALMSGQTTLARMYYPPLGSIHSPTYGVPVTVQSDGTLLLPTLKPIPVKGLNLQKTAQLIADEYVKTEVLKKDNAQANVTLVKSRVNRIVVLREDASIEAASTITRGQVVLHKRGSSTVVDLPESESDVLHALAASGGLPGVDSYNEIWILRRNKLSTQEQAALDANLPEGSNIEEAVNTVQNHVDAVRIPLKLCPGEGLSFTQQDIELENGDVVYIEPRRDEYYYVGGLLPGGQYPLPRDEDLDVIEAIAQATGSVGGLGGTSSVAVLRAGAGVGNIIPPTRVLILRKLPNGQQLAIRVDLTNTMRDPKERVKIMAGDYIMMYYKPGEMLTNSILNAFNINIAANLK